MAQDKLFYGSINNATIFANGSNSFIRVRFDADNASKTLTNIVEVSGYFGINAIIPGQILVASTYFPSGTIVSSVDTNNATITVEDFPAVSGTSGLARVSPPKGQYFINSGSLSVPTNNLTDFADITGSEDPEFISSSNKFGILLQQASTSSLSSAINGDISQYELSKIYDRQSNFQASFYVTSSTSGILSEEPDKAAASGITDFAIVELSYSSSLATIFNQTIAGTPAGGYEVGAYQIALQEFFDNLGSQLEVLYTGSLVQANVTSINFSGSGVEDIIVTGEGAIEVKLKDISDSFPYTGSALITGSLGVTGSFSLEAGNGDDNIFLIKSSSIDSIKVNNEGVVQFFAHLNDYSPTPVLGGLYFTSASAYLGLE